MLGLKLILFSKGPQAKNVRRVNSYRSDRCEHASNEKLVTWHHWQMIKMMLSPHVTCKCPVDVLLIIDLDHGLVLYAVNSLVPGNAHMPSEKVLNIDQVCDTIWCYWYKNVFHLYDIFIMYCTGKFLTSTGNPIIKISQKYDHLIFIKRIPYLERRFLYQEQPFTAMS